MIGAGVRIETVVDATATAAAEAPSRPAATAPSSDEPVARSAAADAARQEIRPTRSASSPTSADPTEPEPDRDDTELIEDDNSSEELLMKHLGAELIDPS
ncbi:MAG: hypothetical protein LWW77_11620 [Propionibacteriales bacterium]|nr:hypothetical protein [Propionibacteriales bacterium]